MEFRLLRSDEARKPGQVRILPYRDGACPQATEPEREVFETLVARGVLTDKTGSHYLAWVHEGGIAQPVFYAACDASDRTTLARAVGAGVKEARANRAASVEVALVDEMLNRASLFAVVRACVLADYRFDRYKTDSDEAPELSVVKILCSAVPDEAASWVAEAKSVAQATNAARDLVNEPANRQTPEDLAAFARDMAGRHASLSVQVLGEKKIASLGMEAFLAVAGAAVHPPRFIVLTHTGRPDSQAVHLGIAGKGIVYDTGGLSLKPSESMRTMKTDMGGAAAALCAMQAMAENRTALNVVCVVAACENAVGATDYRPGDILTSMSGKTVHVANTDAEGRLTLADAVTWLEKVAKAERIVDIATLTGAAEVALGQKVIAALSDDEALYEAARQAASQSTERIWRLPAFDDYNELNEADDADIANAGGRYAGAITAGLFVKFFLEHTPWLHLDIAGPAYTDKPDSLQHKGATGSGTGLLYALAQTLSQTL